MNIMNKNIFWIIGFILCLWPALPCAQVGVGLDLTPSMTGTRKGKKKKKKLKNPYVYHLTRHLELDYIEIRKLQKKGYGRIELIKVILIAQKADVPLKDIIKKRDKLIRLKTISEEYKVNYTDIRRESKRIRAEIETNIKEIPVTDEEPILRKDEFQ